MRYLFTLVCLVLVSPFLSLQSQDLSRSLPVGFAPYERALIPAYLDAWDSQRSGVITPPPGPVRTMAEWEEIEYLVITWTQYIPVLRDIVRYAQEEAKVLIVCSDSFQVKDYLSQRSIPLDRVSFLQAPFNSVWMRDYGANTVYQNTVDSLLLVDWIYNRPRFRDDTLPNAISRTVGAPLYSTTTPPWDLVHTGGNFMSDGLGTAFSSKLILEENSFTGQFNPTNKTEADIDSLMYRFMGIERYIKMDALPYDVINHIDMHMKLLDEETLLVGQYPDSVADGPQIEANLAYVLQNFPSAFGTPYEVVRVEMPPLNGLYPDSPGGHYRTYANAVFVNKTVLVPTYEQRYDTTALRILRESLPGYRVIGINCNQIIPANGALHCITRAVGVKDPLLIVHQHLRDQLYASAGYPVTAQIQHRSGINTAQVYYSADTSQGYTAIDMSLTDTATHTWNASLPAVPGDSLLYYFIEATATNGKTLQRPIVAPVGSWKFAISGGPSTAVLPQQRKAGRLGYAFPNPTTGLTYVPIYSQRAFAARLYLTDVLGREVLVLYEGPVQAGEQKWSFDARLLPSGPYFITLEMPDGRQTQKLLIGKR